MIYREMRALGSLIMRCADANQVPAGGALAVDRDGFAEAVEAAIHAEPLITIERGEVAGLPPEDWDNAIIATGPLTSLPSPRQSVRLPAKSARLLRRDRADRASRLDRHGRRLASVALRQGGSRRHGRRLLNCPMSPSNTRPSSTRCSPQEGRIS